MRLSGSKPTTPNDDEDSEHVSLGLAHVNTRTDPTLEWWTTSGVAAYLGVNVAFEVNRDVVAAR